MTENDFRVGDLVVAHPPTVRGRLWGSVIEVERFTVTLAVAGAWIAVDVEDCLPANAAEPADRASRRMPSRPPASIQRSRTSAWRPEGHLRRGAEIVGKFH